MSDDATETAAPAPDLNPMLARLSDEEAARERYRTNQMVVTGGVGAVSIWQILDQARELAIHYWPEQPETLWTLLISIAAFVLGGGINGVMRRLEL